MNESSSFRQGMTMQRKNRPLTSKRILALTLLPLITHAHDKTPKVEEVHIWGKATDADAVNYTSPTSKLTKQDMVAINTATTEDLVKYEPSLVIRRRFIGDSNGTLGVRGANMFQTSRSMVFADGVPLHYLLQSRWSGAPRWTMVSASEIAQIEVIYGPYSAEYSGNAMGGVILIETSIPQKLEFHADLTLMAQDFAAYGFDDTLDGAKGFVSFGNKQGNLSYYLSYNRLDNTAQPQTYYYGNTPNPAANLTSVTGLVKNIDAIPNADGTPVERYYFGDTGVVDNLTDNYKFKLGYDFGNWSSLLNIAFEDRHSATSPTSYLRDSNNQKVWAGNITEDGVALNIPAARLAENTLERQSVSVGIRLRGELNESTTLEANINQFTIARDDSSTGSANSAYSNFDNTGEISSYDDTGWQTADIKLTFEDLGVEGLNLVSGVRYEAFELNQNIYRSNDIQNVHQTELNATSGGKTHLGAAFLQFNWDINSSWDVSLGARYESFKSRDGYYSDDNVNTEHLDLIPTPNTASRELSPKFALGYHANDQITVRYSLARAYRFPIVEELFSQYKAYNTISEANPELKPENGLHHNLMLDYALETGYVRVNFFGETIKNSIESQAETISTGPNAGQSVRTFVPIDEMQTKGIEFIANQHDSLIDRLDIRFNLTWTDSEIVKNAADTKLEGKTYPRMPEWRSNILITYHYTPAWDISTNLQYASNSFGRNDNTDTIKNVYGAQDDYTRIGLKTTYKFSKQLVLGLGIDNLTNQIAYVAHPWPGRTAYLTLNYGHL